MKTAFPSKKKKDFINSSSIQGDREKRNQGKMSILTEWEDREVIGGNWAPQEEKGWGPATYPSMYQKTLVM